MGHLTLPKQNALLPHSEESHLRTLFCLWHLREL